MWNATRKSGEPCYTRNGWLRYVWMFAEKVFRTRGFHARHSQGTNECSKPRMAGSGLDGECYIGQPLQFEVREIVIGHAPETWIVNFSIR
jgi:hypothetical protein